MRCCCHVASHVLLPHKEVNHAHSFSLGRSVALSPSRSVCHSISVANSLSHSARLAQSVTQSLSRTVCRNQSVTSQSAVSVTQCSHSSSHSLSQSINHQHAPVYPISTSLSRLDYCTQSVGHSLSIYLSNMDVYMGSTALDNAARISD